VAAARGIEERAEHLGAEGRESFDPEAAELDAECRADERRDADGGTVERNDHERGAIEAWLERRGEIGAGDVEEIAPGLCERGEEGALGFGERKVDGVGKG